MERLPSPCSLRPDLHSPRAVNFGHAPSLFCVVPGALCVCAGTEGSVAALVRTGGLALAPPFMATRLLYRCADHDCGLALGEFMVNRMHVHALSATRDHVADIFTLIWVPVFFKLATDDQFMKRFHEKQTTSAPFSVRRPHARNARQLHQILRPRLSVPVGETGMPGVGICATRCPAPASCTWLVRHSSSPASLRLFASRTTVAGSLRSRDW